MVMGLLGTQSGYLKNEEAVSTMEESRHRINAMSLIHQKLYQSVDFSAINMRDYIHELVDYLRDSFDTRQRILFKMEIESISLDITHSIPLGLILNEAITNSIKYAFPGNADGVVNIVFEHTTGNQLQLTVHDNGIGIEPTFANDRSLTMGMNLMQGLCEDIGGSFTIAKQDGTLIKIIFMYDPVVSKKNLPEIVKTCYYCMKEKVLIVEDQYVEANYLRSMLEKAGYAVMGIARSVSKAKEMILADKPGLVLLDIFLSGNKTGIDLAIELKEQNIAFIYLSANSNEEVLTAAKATQPYGFLVKPFRERDLLITLEIAKYRHEHSTESALQRETVLYAQLKDIINTEKSWEEKLFATGKILQPHIPFDYLLPVLKPATTHNRSHSVF